MLLLFASAVFLSVVACRCRSGNSTPTSTHFASESHALYVFLRHRVLTSLTWRVRVRREDNSDERRVFGSVDARREMFRERFNNVWQRINRNVLFAQPVLPTDTLRREYHKLTQIHALRGTAGQLQTVLGVLTQPEGSELLLEDLTDSVTLDLSEATLTSGLFTEGSVVIARGSLADNDVFCVSELGFPPAETRDESLENMVHVGDSAAAPDYFGGAPSAALLARLQHAAERLDERLVFLSDVRLDEPSVMQKVSAGAVHDRAL